jgi:O-antigen ligase
LFINISLILVLSYLLVKAQSVTSLTCLFVGVGILLATAPPIAILNPKRIGRYLLVSFLALAVLVLSFDILPIFIASMGRDMTLTGRTDLWKYLVTAPINPILGAGFESFWVGDRLERIWADYWWHPNQAHNGYLETYLNLGLLGLFLLIAAIVGSYARISKVAVINPDYARLRITFLTIVLLYNISEATFKGIGLLWFTFLLIAIDPPPLLRRTAQRLPPFSRSMHSAHTISSTTKNPSTDKSGPLRGS